MSENFEHRIQDLSLKLQQLHRPPQQIDIFMEAKTKLSAFISQAYQSLKIHEQKLYRLEQKAQSRLRKQQQHQKSSFQLEAAIEDKHQSAIQIVKEWQDEFRERLDRCRKQIANKKEEYDILMDEHLKQSQTEIKSLEGKIMHNLRTLQKQTERWISGCEREEQQIIATLNKYKAEIDESYFKKQQAMKRLNLQVNQRIALLKDKLQVCGSQSQLQFEKGDSATRKIMEILLQIM